MRGGSVMVWVGISHSGKTDLIIVNGNLTALRYLNDIVQPHVIPYTNGNGNHLFQQDNARPHVAYVVRDELQQRNVAVLPWPAISPDLAPIEHVWAERRLRQRQNTPTNLHQLARALIEKWNSIPQYIIRKIIRSMPKRCRAVITAKGGHTRY